jgi:sec-independent protein translocase protein TatA
MPNVGPMELVIVLVIALIVLGPKKLPEVGRSLGKGMREFKDTVSGIGGGDDDDEIAHTQVQARHVDEPVPAPAPTTEPGVHVDPEAPEKSSEPIA